MNYYLPPIGTSMLNCKLWEDSLGKTIVLDEPLQGYTSWVLYDVFLNLSDYNQSQVALNHVTSGYSIVVSGSLDSFVQTYHPLVASYSME